MGPEEVMTAYVEAIRRGDRDAAFALYAEDIVGHVPGRSSLAGERRGRAAVVEYLESAIARAGGQVEVEILDRLVGAEHVALLVRERLGDGADALEMRRANVYRVHGGEITEIWIFEHDQYAVDAWIAGGR